MNYWLDQKHGESYNSLSQTLQNIQFYGYHSISTKSRGTALATQDLKMEGWLKHCETIHKIECDDNIQYKTKYAWTNTDREFVAPTNIF